MALSAAGSEINGFHALGFCRAHRALQRLQCLVLGPGRFHDLRGIAMASRPRRGSSSSPSPGVSSCSADVQCGLGGLGGGVRRRKRFGKRLHACPGQRRSRSRRRSAGRLCSCLGRLTFGWTAETVAALSASLRVDLSRGLLIRLLDPAPRRLAVATLSATCEAASSARLCAMMSSIGLKLSFVAGAPFPSGTDCTTVGPSATSSMSSRKPALSLSSSSAWWNASRACSYWFSFRCTFPSRFQATALSLVSLSSSMLLRYRGMACSC